VFSKGLWGLPILSLSSNSNVNP